MFCWKESHYECFVGKKANVNCLAMCRLDFGSFFFFFGGGGGGSDSISTRVSISLCPQQNKANTKNSQTGQHVNYLL